MSRYPHLLRNAARRPVEIHAADRSVRVLGPGDTLEVDGHDAACDRLVRAGVLTRLAAVKVSPGPDITGPSLEVAPEAEGTEARSDAGTIDAAGPAEEGSPGKFANRQRKPKASRRDATGETP
jgi:hypothetical protein